MKTTYQKNLDIGRAFGNRANTVPAKYYIGLSKTDVIFVDSTNKKKYIKESLFSEVTASDYKRLAIDNNSTTFSVPSNGSVVNLKSIIFPRTESDWGNVYAIGIYDALTGGNLLYISEFEGAMSIQKGTSLILDEGAFENIESDFIIDI